MKYLGWIISIALIVFCLYTYKMKYLPLKQDLNKLSEEIGMWEGVLKDTKGTSGERNRFAVERFFDNNKLTPYGEVEIIRRLDMNYRGIEIYISAPNALTRAQDVMRFLMEQRLTYKNIYCIAVIDSLERFEYKYMK